MDELLTRSKVAGAEQESGTLLQIVCEEQSYNYDMKDILTTSTYSSTRLQTFKQAGESEWH